MFSNANERRKVNSLKRLAEHVLEQIEGVKRKHRVDENLKVSYAPLLKDALLELKQSFPRKKRSWLIRAAVRSFPEFVEQDSKNRWVLKGIPQFGDLYGQYRVSFYETTQKYSCSCFSTMYGQTRKRRICTHIAAVMVYRKIQRKLTRFAA